MQAPMGFCYWRRGRMSKHVRWRNLGPGTASYSASRVRTGARRICIANLMIAAEALCA